MPKRLVQTCLVLWLAAATPAPAQTVFTDGVNISDGDDNSADLFVADDTVLDGYACLGFDCSDNEAFALGLLKLKWVDPSIEFRDTNESSFPDRDWKIRINDPLPTGLERFSIEDLTNGSIPFTIEGGAPSNALYINNNARIGIGTSLPQTELHIVDGTFPSLRLEQDGSALQIPQIWDIFANEGGIGFADITSFKNPFFVEADAPFNALYVEEDGDVGFGLKDPEGILHTKGDGVQLAYFESGDGGPVQIRMRSDSENRRFLATANDDTVRSQIIFKDNDIRFTGQTDSGANLWMIVGPSGLITQGPTCNPGPCDLVFDPEVFTPQTIEDHAAFMWENKHLEAIGPTGPGTQMNMTEKLGGVIHELEVAHIYIEQLHTELLAERARNDAQEALNAALIARLDALEAAISDD